jgi:hypothetical protein
MDFFLYLTSYSHVLVEGNCHLNGSGLKQIHDQLPYTLYSVVSVLQEYNSTIVNMHFTFNKASVKKPRQMGLMFERLSSASHKPGQRGE